MRAVPIGGDDFYGMLGSGFVEVDAGFLLRVWGGGFRWNRVHSTFGGGQSLSGRERDSEDFREYGAHEGNRLAVLRLGIEYGAGQDRVAAVNVLVGVGEFHAGSCGGWVMGLQGWSACQWMQPKSGPVSMCVESDMAMPSRPSLGLSPYCCGFSFGLSQDFPFLE